MRNSFDVEPNSLKSNSIASSSIEPLVPALELKLSKRAETRGMTVDGVPLTLSFITKRNISMSCLTSLSIGESAIDGPLFRSTSLLEIVAIGTMVSIF